MVSIWALRASATYASSGCDVFAVIVIGADTNIFLEARSGSFVSQMYVFECDHVFPIFQFD